MPEYAPQSSRTAVLTNAPSAQDVFFSVVNAETGDVFLADSQSGVFEMALSGGVSIYRKTYTTPAIHGTYLEIWRNSTPTPDIVVIDPDELVVALTQSGSSSFSPAVYATPSDLRAYAPELADRQDAELSGYLLQAQKDVDAYAGYWEVLDTGLKFDLTTLDVPTASAITAATCAQARYRAYMGPVFFIEQQQYDSVGGDVATSARARRYGPEMRSEFPLGYRKMTGRLR